MDEGVGMGIFLDGKVYYGPRMAAGGLGRMVIATSCGRHNQSFRTRLSATDARRWLDCRNRPACETPQRVRQIARWATNGDMLARQVIEESGRYLGIRIANMVGHRRRGHCHRRNLTEAWRLIELPLRARNCRAFVAC